MKTLGLYLHIPFCMQKCRYCDFYSLAGCSAADKDAYVQTLCAHMREYKLQAKNYTVMSVYLGGGTPSLLSADELKMLMRHVRASFRLHPDAEITMEANPGTVDEQKLKAFRRCGVNRISIGVQSFHDEDLSISGRIHTAKEGYEAIIAARKAGFDNISIDLMFGLPGQSLQTVTDNVNTAASLEVDHVSLYGLKIEEGTPFWFDRASLAFPDEETERTMYYTACGLLETYGYKQYEISNFAKTGKKCRHNLRYWNTEEYLGFGPAAHSYFGGKRFSFKRNLPLYLDSFDPEKTVSEPLIDEYIDIPYPSRVAEYVMLRMRLNAGVDCEAFYKRFGRRFDEIYAERLKPFIKSGHVVRTAKGYAFSPEGRYVSNYILARVVDFDLVVPGAQ